MSSDNATNACVHSAIAPNMNRCIKCQRVWDGEKWSDPQAALSTLQSGAEGKDGDHG